MRRILLSLPLCVLLLSSTVMADSYGSYFYRDCRPDNFGKAFKAARESQILNPDARFDLRPVEGLDGIAAEAGYMKYINSFSKTSGQGGGSSTGYLPVMSSPGGGGSQ